MNELKLVQINNYTFINPSYITAIDFELKRLWINNKEFIYDYRFELYLKTLGVETIPDFPKTLEEAGI